MFIQSHDTHTTYMVIIYDMMSALKEKNEVP